MSSAANTLVNNTKWIYVSKIATQLFSVITTILVIRKLSVDVFGTFNLFQTSFVVFQLFTLSWIISVFNRYIPEIEGAGNATKLMVWSNTYCSRPKLGFRKKGNMHVNPLIPGIDSV